MDLITALNKKRALIRNNIETYFPLFSVDEKNKILDGFVRGNSEDVLRIFKEHIIEYDGYEPDDIQGLINERDELLGDVDELKEKIDELNEKKG